ncbi:helix-turn-helix domain-containing protein [Cryptosporangium phraense]|uniref:Helix-turn-helix domain-containing protein n=1 Tax=Cryptosporangium phraense TaxID=2593070 RepID=A0A545AH77_9ACTN|nr:helix-turn-helix domain-containing protein [Cryptosporangium phraense]TQS40667.1 helix-turn-helix domain-containing protein [Cryptosporangium phraense]
MDVFELLGHPARLRIVHALRGDRTLTTAELAEKLPDVSKATVYRHVDALAAGGVLEIAAERRVRGAVERHYRLNRTAAGIDPDTAAALTPDDHRRAFATAMATLAAEFDAYLDRTSSDLSKDAVGYRQHALWLTPDELTALIDGLRAAIRPALDHPYSATRSRYLLSPILFPAETDETPRTSRR